MTAPLTPLSAARLEELEMQMPTVPDSTIVRHGIDVTFGELRSLIATSRRLTAAESLAKHVAMTDPSHHANEECICCDGDVCLTREANNFLENRGDK